VKLPVPILARAGLSPRAVALRCAGRDTTWAELSRAAQARARALRAAGVEPGDLVATLLGNGPDFVELFHASALCGATLLPLNVRLTARELAFQLGDARPRLLVHGDGALAELARRAAHASEWRELALLATPIGDGPEAPLCSRLDVDDPAAVVFTSGTSGSPKGAVLSHGSLVWSAFGSMLHLGHAPGDHWLACLPLFHVGGLSILVRAALGGSTVTVHERFDAERVNAALDEDGITLVSLVAAMLAAVLDARGGRPAPPGLRCALLGGGPTPPELVERALALRFPVVTTYGLTEAASQVATAGTPLFWNELALLSPDGVALPPGEPGEIAVRGPTLMSGYLNHPDETARALRDGWLRTGDVGLRDASGELRVLDRRSDLIVSGGENVYPAEVEAVLLAHPAVAEAGVAGEPEPRLGRRVAAWIVARPGARADAAELDAFCRERLAGYKVPRAYYFVPSLPRGASAKLLRRELRAPEPVLGSRGP
jgi:O-succinylbenzoic acid--CoA ligase